MNKFLIKKLASIEKTYIEKFKQYKFYLVYYYIWELIIKKYFDKLIIQYLLTSDSLVQFLDRNEFGLKNNQIYKKDIIDENTFYGEFKNNELISEIKKDFELTFLDEISKAQIPIDIENYINIFVDLEIVKNFRVYSIHIRFYRTQILIDYKWKFIKQLIIYLIILSLIILMPIYYYNF